MKALHLLWIVPAVTVAGFVAATLLTKRFQEGR